MNKILLIGNSGTKSKVNDGQTIKTRIYLSKMIDEGFDVLFVELDGFFLHPLSIFKKIKKGIKECDRVVLLVGERGARVLIPYINYINRKEKKPFVLPLIGIGVLHSIVDKLSDDGKKRFFSSSNYESYKINKKFFKQICKIDYILPETELISHIYKEYFHLNNIVTLNNFRSSIKNIPYACRSSEVLNIAFISRLWREKGIFDLIDVVERLNKECGSKKMQLDIYGPNSLNRKDKILFESIINSANGVRYLGVLGEDDVVSVLSKYDLLAFPTRYFGEGTPGIIAESLLAGTPILSSDFLQAKCLLKDGYNSVLFKMFDKDDLMSKLRFLLDNREFLFKMRKNALDSAKKYSYEDNRSIFLKYVCGLER